MAAALEDITQDVKITNLSAGSAAKDRFASVLAEDEQIEMVFETITDKVFFTSKRIVVARHQGLTKNALYYSFPYSTVRCFGIDVDNPMTLIKDDSEVVFVLENGQKLQVAFKAKVDYKKISTLVLRYAQPDRR